MKLFRIEQDEFDGLVDEVKRRKIPKGGRPPMRPEDRCTNKVRQVGRWTDEDWGIVQRAAKRSGMTVAGFVKYHMMRLATLTLLVHDTLDDRGLGEMARPVLDMITSSDHLPVITSARFTTTDVVFAARCDRCGEPGSVTVSSETFKWRSPFTACCAA